MSGSWWDDFSNNLATDLAPLVALFGESPTKQYLSECITIEDIIIFASAPMGVITAVVSAIRVRGTPSLRAFIGRAQEGTGVAEAELCSSMSRDVCELYSNGGIARVFGRPKLLEVVQEPDDAYSWEQFYPHDGSQPSTGLYSFEDYIKTERGKHEWGLEGDSLPKRSQSWTSTETGRAEQKTARFAPNPNLSLNVGIRPHGHSWFIAAAALGVALQSREDNYAVQMTVIGTFFLNFGMGLCAHLIESKTEERVYLRDASKPKARIYWVQPGNQNIGDQVFDSFGYSDARSPLKKYITSWKNTNEHSVNSRIWIAVLATSMGFICQFLGLRACHSSVAVVQLGVTLLMSLVRASLRTQRLEKEDNFMAGDPDLSSGHELDHLAYKMAGHNSKHIRWMVSGVPKSMALTSPSSDICQGFESSVLRRILPMTGGSAELTGFLIKSVYPNTPTGTAPNLTSLVERELASWISSKHCVKHGRDDVCLEECEKRQAKAAEIFSYRRRLARLTGLEDLETEHSNHWSAKLVPVRDTALALANAIEDTMQLLFHSEVRPPVTIHESWEQAIAIFWTLQCRLGGYGPYGDDTKIQMSLRRKLDGLGEPDGPWKADRSELEAALGLWLGRGAWREAGNKKHLASKYRIISSCKHREDAHNEALELNLWRDGKDTKIEIASLKHDHFRGRWRDENDLWAVTHEDFKPTDHWRPENEGRERFFVLEMASKGTLLLNAAQEIYSIFLGRILQSVENIGVSSNINQSQRGVAARSETVDKIRGALVKRGLCDEDEAFACTIPIFKGHGLLGLQRKDKVDQVVTSANDLLDHYRIHGNWEESGGLLMSTLRGRYDRVWDKASSLAPSAREEEQTATNSFRLLLVETCEIYLHAILDNKEKTSNFGTEGFLDLLRAYSGDKKTNDMPLVWFEGSVPTGPERRTGNFSLVGATRCYCEAALRHLRNNTSSWAQPLALRLGRHVEQRKVARDALSAIEALDLSSTLYLLQSESLTDAQMALALLYAAQRGWYMVVETLTRLGAAVGETDDDGRCPLSRALEAGDANTVRSLLEHGGTLDDKERKRLGCTPCHHAVKNGHGEILGELMKTPQGAADMNVEDEAGMTPASLAFESRSYVTVRNFLDHGHFDTPMTALHSAIEAGWEDIVERLLKFPDVVPNINHAQSSKVTAPALVCAVRLHHDSIVNVILHAPRVDADDTDQQGRTTLWWAACLDQRHMVENLLKSGKVREPMKVDAEGLTPLSIATQAGAFGTYMILQRTIKCIAPSWRDVLILSKRGDAIYLGFSLQAYNPYRKSHVKGLLEAHGLHAAWRELEEWQSMPMPLGHMEWASEDGKMNLDEILAEVGEVTEDELAHGPRVAASEFQVFVDGKLFH